MVSAGPMVASRTTARCGSTALEHRAYKCRACNAVYQRKYRAAKRQNAGPDPNAPRCFDCGIARGNSMGVKVYQYALIRPVRLAPNVHTNRCVASIAMCDRCLMSHTIPSPSYAAAHGLAERVWPARGQPDFRDDGLRSGNLMPVERAS